MSTLRVLGIESSCDETGVALSQNGVVVAARVASQEVHARWGGVVPELASRLHQKTLSRMAHDLLADMNLGWSDLSAIAATRGPGLIGALLVGASFAKGAAVAHGIPFVGVNHLEGHIWSAPASGMEMPLPALALLVSGGHTELFRVRGFGDYVFLGGTLDDAAGEAFDKVGGLLGLDYPAGAALSKLADTGDPNRFAFPIADTDQPFDYSFSGLKSAVMREARALQQSGEDEEWRADLAASFQQAVVTQLALRVDRALENAEYQSLLVGGGVAANLALRKKLGSVAQRHGVRLLVPPMELCTDNAAMIAWVGEQRLKQFGPDPLDLEADPNLTLVQAS